MLLLPLPPPPGGAGVLAHHRGCGKCNTGPGCSGSSVTQQRLGGGGANSGELSEGAGETFGGLTLLHTATYKEFLDCSHSKAQHSKKGVGL